ncbi:HAD family hydrolase [Paenibacillus nasutitermitis]|nr:HAD family hydrolase [Paenibacillus nasutitermitis]
MNQIRLIVCDLDGTLLSDDHALTEPVKAAVRGFREAGGMFTIATGRFAPAVSDIVEELEIDMPYILCNGGVIADRMQVRSAATLSLEALAPLLLEADHSGISSLLFDDSDVYTFRRTAAVERYEHKEKMKCVLLDLHAKHWQERIVQKVLLIGDMAPIRALWARYEPLFAISYNTIQSEDDYFEIVPPGISKGAALKKLMGMLQVDPSEVLSIGNQMNDLDMLLSSGVGAAVANSHPELLAHASFICSRSNGDGVIEVMEALNLLPLNQ